MRLGLHYSSAAYPWKLLHVRSDVISFSLKFHPRIRRGKPGEFPHPHRQGSRPQTGWSWVRDSRSVFDSCFDAICKAELIAEMVLGTEYYSWIWIIETECIHILNILEKLYSYSYSWIIFVFMRHPGNHHQQLVTTSQRSPPTASNHHQQLVTTTNSS